MPALGVKGVTGANGRARLTIEEEAQRLLVRGQKDGFFEDVESLRVVTGKRNYKLHLQLEPEAQLRVLNVWGQEIPHTLDTGGKELPATRGIWALKNAGAVVRADGYLSLHLGNVNLIKIFGPPRSIDGPADVYLLATSDLPHVRVSVSGAPGRRAFAQITFDLPGSALWPKTSLESGMPPHSRISGAWRTFYHREARALSDLFMR